MRSFSIWSFSSRILPSSTRRQGGSLKETPRESFGSLDSKEDDRAVRFFIEELVRTERVYVEDLESVLTFYVQPFESPEFSKFIPKSLHGRADSVFGNIKEIVAFHRELALSSVDVSEKAIVHIAEKFVHEKERFLRTYLGFFQNASASARSRQLLQRDGRFLKRCQLNAEHDLSLDSFLLKPVQRLTKYQLLLEELHKKCQESRRCLLSAALCAVRDLLLEINASVQLPQIRGFVGNLDDLGRLRLQSACAVSVFNSKNRRIVKTHQRRTLLLFEFGIMICKEKLGVQKAAEAQLEHKNHILVIYMGFEECSALSADSFDVWDVRRPIRFSVSVEDDAIRRNVIRKLSETTVLRSTGALKRDFSVDESVGERFIRQTKLRRSRLSRSEAALCVCETVSPGDGAYVQTSTARQSGAVERRLKGADSARRLISPA